MTSRRLGYLIALGSALLVGLAIRGFDDALPHFVVRHCGDIVWALAVYLATRVVFVTRPIGFSVAVALAFSFAIEFGQMIDVGWLETLRQDTPAKLVLGRGFEWTDNLRYIVGIGLGAALDGVAMPSSKTAGR